MDSVLPSADQSSAIVVESTTSEAMLRMLTGNLQLMFLLMLILLMLILLEMIT
jgi:hypothetical protein